MRRAVRGVRTLAPLASLAARPTCTLLALLLGALGAEPDPLLAQASGLITGRVADTRGAAVSVPTVRVMAGATEVRVVVGDDDGRYRVEGLAAGTYELRAERLGFAPGIAEIRLGAGQSLQLDFTLEEATVELEGVVVDALRDTDLERARFETDPGVTARVIRGETLKSLPGLAEADVMRAVEVLPGVVSTSDFSSAFNVRGGSADQNLILLDGFPIFNPFHLGGLFSVFNSDAIARAELLAGGFGAEYGGRVSSVLTVESGGGADDRLEVAGGVSMLAARVLVRSPLPQGLARALGGRGGSWMVSARRSYFDQLLRPVVDFPYHLTDLQGRAELDLRGGGSLLLTAYTGADVLDLSRFSLPEEDSTEVLRVRWNWGNGLVGLRWRQPLTSYWLAETRVGHSRFSDRLSFVDFAGVRFSSRIEQTSANLDITRDLGGGGAFRMGLSGEKLGYDNLAEAGGTPFIDSADSGTLGAAYATLRGEPFHRWLMEVGVRLDGWMASEDEFGFVSPRLAVKRFLGDDREAAVKVAAGRYVQFLHSMRDESLPVSNDLWIVAGGGVPAVVSDQVQAGVERYWGDDWSASVEAYYRHFDGVTEVNLAADPNDPTDDVLAGRGRSVGLDLLVRRNSGPVTGWATLSFLRAERTLPDPAARGWDELSPEVTFPPVFDRRADLDVVLQYDAPRNVELGLRWNFGSPLPYTRPVAQYYAWRYSPLDRRYRPRDTDPEEVPVYVQLGDRNGERYPAYHRLDVTVRRTFERSWGEWTPYLQVLNVYNRRNVLWYFYNYDRSPPVRSGLSMFPVLPALGVEISF